MFPNPYPWDSLPFCQLQPKVNEGTFPKPSEDDSASTRPPTPVDVQCPVASYGSPEESLGPDSDVTPWATAETLDSEATISSMSSFDSFLDLPSVRDVVSALGVSTSEAEAQNIPLFDSVGADDLLTLVEALANILRLDKDRESANIHSKSPSHRITGTQKPASGFRPNDGRRPPDFPHDTRLGNTQRHHKNMGGDGVFLHRHSCPSSRQLLPDEEAADDHPACYLSYPVMTLPDGEGPLLLPQVPGMEISSETKKGFAKMMFQSDLLVNLMIRVKELGAWDMSQRAKSRIVRDGGRDIEHACGVSLMIPEVGVVMTASPESCFFPGSCDRVVIFTAPSVDALLEVLRIVSEFVHSWSVCQNRRPSCRLAVPRATIGSLIGKSGQGIQGIRQTTGARVHVSSLFVTPDEACGERVVTVSSRNPKALETAFITIVARMNDHDDKASCPNLLYSRRPHSSTMRRPHHPSNDDGSSMLPLPFSPVIQMTP